MRIDITSTTLEYKAVAKIDEDDEGEDGGFPQRIHIQTSINPFVLGTLSWLLDNIHHPSFSSPVPLNIREIASPHVITPIIDRLASVITELTLGLTDVSSAKTILSYITEPFQVVIDGAAKLSWPLPKLTDLSLEQCSDLEPEFIMGCIQRRAGHGTSLEGRPKHQEELPSKLTRLGLPYGSSTIGLLEMFPDYKEWSGLDMDQKKNVVTMNAVNLRGLFLTAMIRTEVSICWVSRRDQESFSTWPPRD
ncbi:hypothetical protein FRB95_006884 [Tulasnella sp. JGI-2019a]|nr:hypothetical protein FRB95_006884 [Tulasnella sp. JGI-2019a]